MRKLIAGTVLAAAVVAGAGTGYALHSSSGPACPTEDSCSVSYSGGAWHVTRITP